MEIKSTIHLDESEIRDILKTHIQSKGYVVNDIEILVRGKEGDIQIPKGANGDCVGIIAQVETNK